MKNLFILALFSVLSFQAFTQSAHQSLRDGDYYYNNEDYVSAELAYRKAFEDEPSLKSYFNLGNSLYNQERYEEAIDQFQMAVSKANTPEISSEAYYNLANAYFQNQDLEQALSAYKKAILEDANNKEAQYNFIVCKEILKKKQQQQQQQQCDNPSESKDGEQQEQQEQEEQQEQQEGEQEQQEQEEQDGDDQEEKQDSTQDASGEGAEFDSTRLEKQTLDSLDAAKLLQVIESEEQKVQEKLRKFNSNRKKQEKDW